MSARSGVTGGIGAHGLVVARHDAVQSSGNETVFNLRKYFERGRNYRVYVGTPLADPIEWIHVERLEADLLVAADGSEFPLGDVRAAIVAYPNGEILECANTFGTLPEGVTFVDDVDDDDGENPVTSELDPRSLEAGCARVSVRHSAPRLGPDGEWTYRTTLENVSGEPVRVIKFGGYAKRDGRWMLHTVTGGFFTAEQFAAWYGLETALISPGTQVSDPDNYGGPNALWAYFCRTEAGEAFVCGASVDRLPSESDFIPHGTEDEKSAWRNFGGLTVDEARARFAENPLRYQEDFMWMGTNAFLFYFPVLVDHLRRVPDAEHDDDHEAWILSRCIKTQFEPGTLDRLRPLVPAIVELAAFVRENIRRFGCDDEERQRVARAWRDLANHIEALA